MFLFFQLIRFIDHQGLHLLAGLVLEEGDCLGRKLGGGGGEGGANKKFF